MPSSYVDELESKSSSRPDCVARAVLAAQQAFLASLLFVGAAWQNSFPGSLVLSYASSHGVLKAWQLSLSRAAVILRLSGDF